MIKLKLFRRTFSSEKPFSSPSWMQCEDSSFDREAGSISFHSTEML
jgi:hypothetical protein